MRLTQKRGSSVVPGLGSQVAEMRRLPRMYADVAPSNPNSTARFRGRCPVDERWNAQTGWVSSGYSMVAVNRNRAVPHSGLLWSCPHTESGPWPRHKSPVAGSPA